MLRFLRSYTIEISIFIIFGLFILLLTSGITWLIEFDSWLKEIQPNVAPQVQNGVTIFLSIFIEGLPFILIGVLISSLIHTFVRQEHIWRFVPRSPFISIPLASVMGLILPICECGIIPIARRLIQKQLPAYVAFTFLLAAPIVNPITILSTYLAFAEQGISMALSRTSIGIAIAIIMGAIFALFFRNKEVLRADKTVNHNCTHDDCDHEHPPHASEHIEEEQKQSVWARLGHSLHHAIFEWMDMGKFFIIGAAIAAFFHTFIGLSVLRSAITEEWWAILVLMFLAYVLSICSSADAFVAASFRGVVGNSPLLAFLVYGPMMDIKNVIMMMSAFRIPVVLTFIGGTTILTYIMILMLF